jgi:hypothetical protein
VWISIYSRPESQKVILLANLEELDETARQQQHGERPGSTNTSKAGRCPAKDAIVDLFGVHIEIQ